MEAVTRQLAIALHEQYQRSLPDTITHAARRSWLNVLGTTIGASQHAAIDAVLAAGQQLEVPGTDTVPGRAEKLDRLTAARAIGTAGHLDDFDDTHLATVIHPGAATLAAVWTIAREAGTTGELALRAFALGIEAQLRTGNAISPWHYDDGWHITGTCGPIGAAVAAGLLLDLNAERLGHAIALAASQSLGIRDAFGTMMKPFHAGQAGANGVLAAELAAAGLQGSTAALEGPRGFIETLSPHGSAIERILAGFAETWEIERNAFKPYPCGIVSHPAIDAAIALSQTLPAASTITSVRARVHPLVPELTGNLAPRDGLQARFSTAHGIAAGLVDGRVGLPQYADDRALADDISAVRSLVRFEVDESCPRDAATVTLHLDDGMVHEHHVEHARGSEARPLSDEELAAKVRDLVEPVLPDRTEEVFLAVAGMVEAPSLADLVAATTPRGAAS